MFATKVGLFLCLLVVIVSANPNPKPNHVLGGATPMGSLKKAASLLESTLSKLAAGGGPHYKVDKVHSATKQVVAGTLYRINADLVNTAGDKKLCDAKIVSVQWMGEISITLSCDGEAEVTGTYKK